MISKKFIKNKKEDGIALDKAEKFISTAAASSKVFESCDCSIITSIHMSHVENSKKTYDFSFLFPKATVANCRIKVFSNDPEISSYIPNTYLLTNADIANIKNKTIAFDVLLTTVRDMSDLGSVHKILGPKKMVPTENRGTLAKDITSLKRLFLEWSTGQRRKVSMNLKDNCCDINFSLGKLTSSSSDILSNMNAFLAFIDDMIVKQQSFVFKTKRTFRVTKVMLSSTQGKKSCRIK